MGGGRERAPTGGLSGPEPVISCLPGLVCGQRIQSPNMAAWPRPSSLRTGDWSHGFCCLGLARRVTSAGSQLQGLAHPEGAPLTPNSESRLYNCRS